MQNSNINQLPIISKSPSKSISLVDSFKSFISTEQIPIPKNAIEQIIGQDEAVKIATIAAKQKRNMLMVGPPGTGKSLLAQSISLYLNKPSVEVNVLHNPETPERPTVEIRTAQEIENEKKLYKQMEGKLADPIQVPGFVAERLGFRCRRCSKLSSSNLSSCPNCGAEKFIREDSNSPFGDLLGSYLDERGRQDRVHTTKLNDGGLEEVVVYERQDELVRVLDQKLLEKLEEMKKKTPRKTIVPFNRNNFVVASGASETELLGDVKHDPYGGHQGQNSLPSLGTLPYLRVVPGAIHEAHEGVLFIDEVSSLEYVQRYLLTAMQERTYPIVGRNPHSSGASVKVEGVPCEFILIAASNINDVSKIIPPLRSRILGNGYEVLLENSMPDTEYNRAKLAQFVAQEVRKDGKIPHFSKKSVDLIIEESKRRAKEVDNIPGALTLRLRELSGIVRLAGDISKSLGEQLVLPDAVTLAIKRGKNIEEQLNEKYGSLWKASQGDVGRTEKGRTSLEIH